MGGGGGKSDISLNVSPFCALLNHEFLSSSLGKKEDTQMPVKLHQTVLEVLQH